MAAGFAAGVLAELIIQPLEQMDKVHARDGPVTFVWLRTLETFF
jgi:hypothetical protein